MFFRNSYPDDPTWRKAGFITHHLKDAARALGNAEIIARLEEDDTWLVSLSVQVCMIVSCSEHDANLSLDWNPHVPRT